MKLDINLAREPFRSFKLYYLLTGMLGFVAVAMLLWLGSDLLSALSERSALAGDIAEARARADHAQKETKRLLPYVEKKTLERAIAEAAEVRSLIERRMFDWDRLFSELEQLTPNNVRLADVGPRVSEGGLALQVRGVARGINDQNEMVDRLEASDLFDGVFVTNQSASPGGEVEFTLQAQYRGAGRPEVKGGTTS